MPDQIRTPAELVEQWLAITPRPAALRDLLAEYPLQVAKHLMPDCSGIAIDGQLWLDAGLVANPDRSARWLLATYLHEVAHCHLQRRGQCRGHSKVFAEIAWALALQHGVAERVNVGYDLHECDTPGDVLAYATAGARSLAATGDPLAAADRRLWRDYTTFYGILLAALAVVLAGLLLFMTVRAGWLPSSLPDVLRSDWTLRAAGLAMLAGAVWSAAR